jgi:hypothetical protein
MWPNLARSIVIGGFREGKALGTLIMIYFGGRWNWASMPLGQAKIKRSKGRLCGWSKAHTGVPFVHTLKFKFY